MAEHSGKMHHGTTYVDDRGQQSQPPPYQPSYPHPPPIHHQPGPTIVTQMVPGIVIQGNTMGPDPCHITCRACQAQIVTRTDTKATSRTHIAAFLLCLFGCWPCVCIPYCMNSCMNIDHYCPNCGSFVGTYMS